MKKLSLVTSILALLSLLAFNAHAVQFDLNLSTLDANYGNYTDIFRIQVDGFADVNQSFGDDGIFNDGDTFTETTILQEISYKKSLLGSNQYFDGLEDEGKFLYLYGAGLTGEAYNVTASDPTDLTTYLFNYSFDPGIGDIGIYIDVDDGNLDHNAATAELVAKFSLTKGDGAALDGFLGGLAQAGTTRLTGEFLDITPDNVWKALGLDLGDLPAGYAAFAQLNTTNQVIVGPDVYLQRDAQGQLIPGGFTAIINSTGHMDVSVVPEPSTFVLLSGGLLGLAYFARRRKK